MKTVLPPRGMKPCRECACSLDLNHVKYSRQLRSEYHDVLVVDQLHRALHYVRVPGREDAVDVSQELLGGDRLGVEDSHDAVSAHCQCPVELAWFVLRLADVHTDADMIRELGRQQMRDLHRFGVVMSDGDDDFALV